MCERLTRKGRVFHQGCNYGPVAGTIYRRVLNNGKLETREEELQVCSGCGKVVKYDQFLGELFKDWRARKIDFHFIPTELGEWLLKEATQKSRELVPH